jgi:hypothetical protein
MFKDSFFQHKWGFQTFTHNSYDQIYSTSKYSTWNSNSGQNPFPPPLYSRFTSENKTAEQVEDWLFQQKAWINLDTLFNDICSLSNQKNNLETYNVGNRSWISASGGEQRIGMPRQSNSSPLHCTTTLRSCFPLPLEKYPQKNECHWSDQKNTWYLLVTRTLLTSDGFTCEKCSICRKGQLAWPNMVRCSNFWFWNKFLKEHSGMLNPCSSPVRQASLDYVERL